MARRVFFSFHYANDVWRANIVRHGWVTQGKEVAGYIDKAEFEKVKKKGKKAIENWIDNQLKGTSVTVVLIGSKTLDRPYVQYEIRESIRRENAIIGVQIGSIKNRDGKTTTSQSQYKLIDGKQWFSDVVEGFYDYSLGDGYSNLGKWIENAAKAKGK